MADKLLTDGERGVPGGTEIAVELETCVCVCGEEREGRRREEEGDTGGTGACQRGSGGGESFRHLSVHLPSFVANIVCCAPTSTLHRCMLQTASYT